MLTQRPVWDVRRKFFETHMRELGIFDERHIFLGTNFSVESGYQVGNLIAEKYEETGVIPEAFLVASDPLAVGVLQAFNEHQIQVPDQTAIISINDIDVAKYVSPPLTTYHLNVHVLGQTAVEALSDTVNAPEQAKRTILLSSKIVYRKSFPEPVSTTSR